MSASNDRAKLFRPLIECLLKAGFEPPIGLHLCDSAGTSLMVGYDPKLAAGGSPFRLVYEDKAAEAIRYPVTIIFTAAKGRACMMRLASPEAEPHLQPIRTGGAAEDPVQH